LADLGPDGARAAPSLQRCFNDRLGRKKRPIKDRAHGSDGGGRARKTSRSTDALFRARALQPSRESRLRSHPADTVRLAKGLSTLRWQKERFDMNKGRQDCLRGRDEARRKSVFLVYGKSGVSLPAPCGHSLKKKMVLSPAEHTAYCSSMPEKRPSDDHRQRFPNVPGFAIGQLFRVPETIGSIGRMRLQREFGDICQGAAGGPSRRFSSARRNTRSSVLVENAQHFVKSRGLRLTRPLLG